MIISLKNNSRRELGNGGNGQGNNGVVEVAVTNGAVSVSQAGRQAGITSIMLGVQIDESCWGWGEGYEKKKATNINVIIMHVIVLLAEDE